VFWVCICSLIYPAFKPLRHIVICGLYFCTAFLFCTLSHKQHDFRKKVTEIKCVVIFSKTFVCIIFRSKKKWTRCGKMYIGIHVRCLLLASDFNETRLLSTDCRKMLKYQVSWKSVQWEPSCYSTYRQTWRSWWFSNFANAPVKCKVLNSHGGIEDSSLSSSLDGGQRSAWNAGRLNAWRGRRCPLSAPHSPFGGFQGRSPEQMFNVFSDHAGYYVAA
jgi:hypothetical protein